jgi:hypothetical protein
LNSPRSDERISSPSTRKAIPPAVVSTSTARTSAPASIPNVSVGSRPSSRRPSALSWFTPARSLSSASNSLAFAAKYSSIDGW